MELDMIKNIMDAAIESHSENGAAAVITKDGKEVYSCAAGYADVEGGVPFSEDTICRAFSCSKVITATAAMQLLERGKLDTSWELGWFIPEFSEAYYIRDGKKLESPKIRIRDLLNMTSGIPYPGDSHEGIEGMNDLWGELDKSINDGKSLTTAEFAAKAGKTALMFPAGAEWMYGSSADIMGAVIEKLTGMRYGDYLRENIFAPLGMEDTAFYVPADKRDRLAVLYENAAQPPKKPDWVNLCIYDYDKPPAFESGGAGIFTTARDLSRLGAELSCGGKGVISRSAVRFMQQNGLTPEQKRTFDWDSCKGFGYANFVRTLEDPNAAGLFATKGSFGWDGWTGTFLLNDPTEKISVTLFVQRTGAGTTPLARGIVNAAYAALGQ
ncbi:serine hydrolase domain-containing protein [Ruminococcus sp. NK3A76]|uniref:serine hydrolase domain-containing protein n=1 Tax=Ruminococcus sp. NK3A76 TaxID=877411 RepID=UPI00048E3217|nr:serine hydrolase domain-containing protein [Ruminococcus sp. NK3A76]